LKAREGDLIEALDGNIFDVKGLIHPPDKIIAFIRFTPDPKGERKRNNTRYKKVYPLRERYTLLRKKFPQYLVLDPVFNQWLCEVPKELVKQYYEPSKFLRQLRSKSTLQELEAQALELAKLLQRSAEVDWRRLGVSGSLLAGLHTPKSDIDLIVHGSSNCQKVYNMLKHLLEDAKSGLKFYNRQELKTLFDFRSKDTTMSFEDFVRTESRKVLQGRFQRRDYFIRFIKDWNEVTEKYSSVNYKPMGETQIKATISDDSQTIFTPCTYRIENAQTLEGRRAETIREIVSFRGRFCEQARIDETVVARGMVERIQQSGKKERFRLVIGNKPSDYMILAN
jgi:predicted nucleotidyltransferase